MGKCERKEKGGKKKPFRAGVWQLLHQYQEYLSGKKSSLL